MRLLNTILFTTICCIQPIQSSASNYYRIQIGAFVKSIPFTHFAFSGISDVYLDIDNNNIHHYYLRTTFEEYPKANMMKDSLISKGFSNAIVIKLLKNSPYSKKTGAPSPTLLKGKSEFSTIFYYHPNQYKLTTSAKKELNVLAKQLKKNPDLKIALFGHTDARGNAISNIALSKNRIRAIKQYLIDKGISKNQIVAKACGEAKPLLSNSTENGIDLPENRKLNRRVVILSINKKGEIFNNISNKQTVHPILEREQLKD